MTGHPRVAGGRCARRRGTGPGRRNPEVGYIWGYGLAHHDRAWRWSHQLARILSVRGTCPTHCRRRRSGTVRRSRRAVGHGLQFTRVRWRHVCRDRHGQNQYRSECSACHKEPAKEYLYMHLSHGCPTGENSYIDSKTGTIESTK